MLASGKQRLGMFRGAGISLLLAWGLLMTGLFTSGCDSFIAGRVFFPERALMGDPAGSGMAYEDVWMESDGGVRLHGWWIPAAPSRAVMLFCHGNAGNISHRLENLKLLHQAGVSVLIFDYRGYGKSGGSIGMDGFLADALAAHAAARKLSQKRGEKLVVFGRSLGGIAAVHAARLGADGLILESTFTTLGDMARHHFWIPLPGSLAKRLNALGEIKALTMPKLFIHGDEDDIVPIGLGQRLYEAAPGPKRFVTISEAGHNDTYFTMGDEYFETIGAFIAGLDGQKESQGG